MFEPQLLAPWGWHPHFSIHLPDPLHGRPARVLTPHRGAWLVQDGLGQILAHLSGAMRHRAPSPAALPTVGDWVLLEPTAPLIHEILPRQNVLQRRQAGGAPHPQLLAANVNTALLICGLDPDYNPRRIERALAQVAPAVDSVIIVLNKSDLCHDLDRRIREAQGLGAKGVVALSAIQNKGLEDLTPFLVPSTTSVLLGSSGAGKSTLMNALLGEEKQRTQSVRIRDGRGRHTTSRRELFQLPNGALIIDTPGLREWQLWDMEQGMDLAFFEISDLGQSCRFRDCRHEGEPGCAVQAAIDAETLDAHRVANFRKLRRESDFQLSLVDESTRRARKAREKLLSRTIRRYEKE